MNATMKDVRKFSAIEEHTVGTEDRVFLGQRTQPIGDPEAGWYWQARGCDACNGPFGTREEAAADYDAA